MSYIYVTYVCMVPYISCPKRQKWCPKTVFSYSILHHRLEPPRLRLSPDQAISSGVMIWYHGRYYIFFCFFQVWPITSYDASWILGFSSYASSCIKRNYLSSRRDQVYPSPGALVLHAHVGSTPTVVFLLSFLLVYIFSLATKLHTKDPFHAERLGHRRLH
jgi:hypothetical protein